MRDADVMRAPGALDRVTYMAPTPGCLAPSREWQASISVSSFLERGAAAGEWVAERAHVGIRPPPLSTSGTSVRPSWPMSSTRRYRFRRGRPRFRGSPASSLRRAANEWLARAGRRLLGLE